MMITFALLIAGVLLIAVVAFGHRREGYLHHRHTISELGEVGSADQTLVNWGVFLPVGLGCLTIAFLVSQSSGPADLVDSTRLLAASLAAGYLVASFFPCDPGSPLHGSWRQGIHNLGGGAQYIGGLFALVLLEPVWGTWALGAAVVVGLGTLGLSVPAMPGRGLIQRVVETILYASLITSIWLLQAHTERVV